MSNSTKNTASSKTKELHSYSTGKTPLVYALPIFYFAKTQRGISAGKLQKLVQPYSNELRFFTKLLHPEKLTLGFVFRLAGVIQCPVDICIGLLFSVYRNEKPAYYIEQQAPYKVYFADQAKERRRQKKSTKKISLSKSSRNRALGFFHTKLAIPADELKNYMGFSTTATMSNRFMWPTEMTFVQICRLCTLTDLDMGEVLNRLIGNTGQKESVTYIRPEKVAGVPVRRFEKDERITEHRPKRYNHTLKQPIKRLKNSPEIEAYIKQIVGTEKASQR